MTKSFHRCPGRHDSTCEMKTLYTFYMWFSQNNYYQKKIYCVQPKNQDNEMRKYG